MPATNLPALTRNISANAETHRSNLGMSAPAILVRLRGLIEEQAMPRIYVMMLGVLIGWTLLAGLGWVLWQLVGRIW